MTTHTWYFVGMVERWDPPKPGRPIGRCRWKRGYSQDPNGNSFPWVTRNEARKEGVKCIFLLGHGLNSEWRNKP